MRSLDAETVAAVIFVSVVCIPVVIYVVAHAVPRCSRYAYLAMGAVCLVVAAGFFSFTGWYFIETGQLVSPGKYGPSSIVEASASPFERIVVGAFNIGMGLALAVTGVAMLRIKRS